MKPLVSVIVPVYKVEDRIRRCLDSLCRQSLRDIEIILIDDASPDSCGEICEEYAAQDDRFKVIHHEVNRGLSVARNTGIAQATADYLMFVDSDDYVHKDFCREPYECAIRKQADLVIFRRHNFESGFNLAICETFRLFFRPVALLKNGYKTTAEALDLLLHADVGVVAWDKLYSKNLFNDISYPVGFLYEDKGTTYKTVLKASCIYYIDKVLYYKCFHDGSITTIRSKKALQDWLVITRKQYRDLTGWGGYPVEKFDMLLIYDAMHYCITNKRDFSDPYYMFYMKKLLSCKHIPEGFIWKRKVLFVLFQFCPSLFELICTQWGKKYES